MLLQTNSYIVPKEKRAEHARLMRRFRQVLNRIGCDDLEIYEQVGANWSSSQTSGRFVQIMRFRDRRHQLAVQNAERTDPQAQALIAEFCELINYPYQQQQQQFAVGFYTSVLPIAPARGPAAEAEGQQPAAPVAAMDETAPQESHRAAQAVDEAPLESDMGGETEQGTIDSETLETGEVGEVEEAEHSDETHPPEHPAHDDTSDPTDETGEALPFDESLETPADEGLADEELADEHQSGADSEQRAGEHADAHEPVSEEAFGHEETAATDDEHAGFVMDDDDISRLAEELTAGEEPLDPHGHGQHPGGKRASDNGAH